MSSKAASVTVGIASLSLILGWVSNPLAAQDDGAVTELPQSSVGSPSEDETDFSDDRINLLITVPRSEPSAAQIRECEERIEAGEISGEIVVCRQLGDDPDNYYSGSREEAQRRYAEETAFQNDPQTPYVCGPFCGIFTGPPTVSDLCIIPPCPGEPALIIDVEALPEAPPGSDADRIARGLPPLGREEPSEEEIKRRREALGLPPPAFNSGESGAQEDQPSDSPNP